MGIESLSGLNAQNVVSAKEQNGAGRMIAGSNAIYQNDRVQSNDAVCEIERRSAEVGDLDVLAEAVFGFETMTDVWPNGIVTEQDIPDSADQDSPGHKIFASAIFRPAGSKA
jgi:hypothetical protein